MKLDKLIKALSDAGVQESQIKDIQVKLVKPQVGARYYSVRVNGDFMIWDNRDEVML